MIRANKLAYVSKVLEKLLVWQKTGVKVQVGGGPLNPGGGTLKTAFIFFIVLVAA